MGRRKKIEEHGAPDWAQIANDIRALSDREHQLSLERERRDEYGRQVPPGAEYMEAAQAVLEAYDLRAIPIARHAMAYWHESFKRLAARLDLVGDDFYGVQHAVGELVEYWRSRDAARQSLFRQPPRLRPRVKPAAAHAAGVSLRQIAMDWNWRDVDGLPDEERVERELAEPGSELTPAAIALREEQMLVELGFKLSAAELAALELEFSEPSAP